MKFRNILAIVFALGIFAPAFASEQCLILLHGLSRSMHSMDKIAKAAEGEGYKVVNVGYPSRSATISVLSEAAMSKALGACGEVQTSFVTHSMGGILLRDYYARHRSAPRPFRVVMIAPPNRGSAIVDDPRYDQFGAWWMGSAGKQLSEKPDSFVNQLPPVDYPVGIIAGDRSINPLFSSVLKGANDGSVSVNNTAVVGMRDWIVIHANHSFITDNPSVINQVMNFLRNGEFVKPST